MVWGRSVESQPNLSVSLGSGEFNGRKLYFSQGDRSGHRSQSPRVSIDVQETNGTADNLKQIEANKADLATAQADVPAGGIARTVAILYSDSFQVVVQGKSTLRKFTDLKGKRIGLTPKGGQYASFLQVAQHFGLAEKDFTFIGDSDQNSDLAFQQGQVDAIFRVSDRQYPNRDPHSESGWKAHCDRTG